MVGIILASHGEFAKGILQSSQMIFGEQENLEAVTFMPSEGPDDLQAHLRQAVDRLGGKEEEILFLVDLWGGSPFNQANLVYEEMKGNSAIVSGLNLPMLLEALGGRMGVSTAHEVAEQIINAGRNGVKVLPENLEAEEETPEVEISDKKAALLPEGTVLGDGKIKYVLARIDTRLLHGQVATNWVKTTNPTRIIVVSDKVAHDEMRKTLIKQAAPPGAPANVIPVSKFAKIDKDPRFGSTKALLLFESPQDVLESLEAGVSLESINNTVNVGSMAHSKGKTMISNAVSVDQEDLDCFKEMEDKYGLTFSVQKVPADKAENLNDLLKDKGLSI